MTDMKLTVARHDGVDLGRVLGCFSIILLHQSAADYGKAGLISDIFDQAARWAVPFFFVMAGYFTRFEIGSWAVTKRLLGQVLPLYLAWFAFYVALADPAIVRLNDPLWLAAALVFGGPGFHLWFMPSLILCVALAAIILDRWDLRRLVIVAGLFYLAGLAFGSYETVVFSPEFVEKTARLNTRSGPFFGMLFVAIGAMLRSSPPPPQPAFRGALLFLMGILFAGVEALALLEAQGVPILRHDFLFGTILAGYGSALLFTNTRLPNGVLRRAIVAFGPVTFGIYAVHLIVLKSVTSWIEPRSLMAGLGVAALVFGLSSSIAFVGRAIPVLRRIFH